ncbi:MAG: XRE family transcriptional regulator [Candidatus Obscuribacterales bacterium]|nr:XRE family transcriptional regulator [Candidatus Obscuribacterales bacterium]
MQKRNEATRRKRKYDMEESSGNVFKDIGFDDDEAASLLARAELISKLRDLIEASGMSQRQIASVLRVRQPRVAEIMGMKTQCFSVDLLLRYLARLGTKVSFNFEHETGVA